MIVTVAGPRDWKNKQQVADELDRLFREHVRVWCEVHFNGKPDLAAAATAFILRHGVSGNVDFAANDWGIERGVTIERFRAEWHDPVTRVFQPWAGPARNKLMAQALPRADLWLAFWDGKFRIRDGKKISGTHGGILLAVEAGLEVSIKPPR